MEMTSPQHHLPLKRHCIQHSNGLQRWVCLDLETIQLQTDDVIHSKAFLYDTTHSLIVVNDWATHSAFQHIYGVYGFDPAQIFKSEGQSRRTIHFCTSIRIASQVRQPAMRMGPLAFRTSNSPTTPTFKSNLGLNGWGRKSC